MSLEPMKGITIMMLRTSLGSVLNKEPTAYEAELKGVLEVCDVPLASVDFWCSDVSSTIDSSLTMVRGDDMVKVVARYDNQWGYSQSVVDSAHLVASKWPDVAAARSGDSSEDYCKTNPADKECKVYEA
ncbi:glyceraldehyde-3-phosphate dehydrogenase B, chloroplastic-like [Hibiscus syriacus]|uniref:glyceraldehyde-3-phosphate dehydrogenase B, chloroplastic-like n=1 Tax=Hibiscus syriacus TaxID=106335 RepID=UPI001920FC99|nr:glyceraldehyde-3-phosphate dehydrogenase B, chloroplastic-like [Hibiscus syriacus]